MDYTIPATGLVAFLLYLNTLSADFAYDDSRAIQKNPDLLPETPILNLLYDDFWGTSLVHSGSHKSYRPLCVLSFRLNYYLDGLNPKGYHLGNIILHTVVTCLFTHMVRLLLNSTLPTLIAGLLFASHPIHTEAVAGIVGRADVGSCLFFILTFLCYIGYTRYRDGRTRLLQPGHSQRSAGTRFVYFAGVCSFTTASMLTKEQGITVLGVCLAFEMFVQHKLKPAHIVRLFTEKSYRGLLEGMGLLLLCGTSLVTFRLYFMGNKPPDFAPSDNPAADSDSFLTRTLTFNLLPSLNLWMLLCPCTLSFDWSMEAIPLVESIWDFRNIFTLTFYLILLYFAHYILTYLHKSTSVQSSTIFKSIRPSHVKAHANGNSSVCNAPASYVTGNAASQTTKSITTSYIRKRTPTFRRNSSSSTDSNDDMQSVKVAYQSYKTPEIVILSLALIVFPYIPASNLFFYVGFVIAERVLYIPSMGVCLLVSHAIHVIYRRVCKDKVPRTVLYILVTLVLMCYCVKTVIRNRDWQSEEKLYQAGIPVNPAKAWGNLANILNSQGKSREAELAYRNALKYRGNMADVHYNLGILLQDQKRLNEAVDSYQTAIQCRPKLTLAHLNLAIVLDKLGRTNEAEKVYKHCAEIDIAGLKDPRLHESTKISALYNLGRIYADTNRLQESIRVYKDAIHRMPEHYQPHSLYNMLGETYLKIPDYDEAERWYHEALKVKPDHVPAHLTMANMYSKKGHPRLAEEWYRKAFAVSPDDISIDQHYAHFLADIGRLDDALAHYERVIKTTPHDFEIVFNAANVYRQMNKNGEAEDLYRQAAQLRPDVATAHMNLGAMLHLNGKHTEAESSYLEALRLQPDDDITQQNLIKLRNLIVQKSKL